MGNVPEMYAAFVQCTCIIGSKLPADMVHRAAEACLIGIQSKVNRPTLHLSKLHAESVACKGHSCCVAQDSITQPAILRLARGV